MQGMDRAVRWVWKAAAILIGLALLPAACSSSAAPAPTGKRELALAWNSGVANLDPARSCCGPFSSVQTLASEPLIHAKYDGTFAPALATSWRYVGSGNQTFEITLRREARFSDGTEVNAQAVKNWIDYFLSVVTSRGYFPIKSTEVTGPWTVRINLASPHPAMPLLLAEPFNLGFVNGPKALANPDSLKTETDGAGPYMVVPSDSLPGDHYTFIPNPYYYNKSAVQWSKVTVKVIASPTSALAALQSGQVEVAVGDPSTAAAAEAAGFQVVHQPTGTYGLVFMDRSRGPLVDLRVRQALNYAVDRKTITTTITGKYGQVTSEQVSGDGFDPKYQNYYRYDPAKAKSLLADAGYSSGFNLDVLVFSGFSDTFNQLLAQNLSAVGVKLNFITATTLPDFGKKLTSGKYPAVISAQSAASMVTSWDRFIRVGSTYYQHGPDDPVMNKLHDDGMVSADPKPYWIQMSQRLVTEAYQLPVHTYDTFLFVSKHVGGVNASAATGTDSYVTDWYPK